jgi:glutamate dehydrogenase (NADP+)
MLKTRDEGLEGKICSVSGAGNVAQYTAEKLIQLGARVVTLSDSEGMIYDPAGITLDKLEWVKELKNVRRGRISEYSDKFRVDFYKGQRPWGVKCDCAFPSATQNEISTQDAENLLDNGCYVISEGANMPTQPGGVERFLAAKILYGPGKAANAGGVATSALEMAQNAMHLSWTREEVDERLADIMATIHKTSYETADDYGHPGNLVMGANIAGFVKVADAMIDQGLV